MPITKLVGGSGMHCKLRQACIIIAGANLARCRPLCLLDDDEASRERLCCAKCSFMMKSKHCLTSEVPQGSHLKRIRRRSFFYLPPKRRVRVKELETLCLNRCINITADRHDKEARIREVGRGYEGGESLVVCSYARAVWRTAWYDGEQEEEPQT